MLLITFLLTLCNFLTSFSLLFTLPLLSYSLLTPSQRKTYRHEFLSTSLMIFLTFSPGKWSPSDYTQIGWHVVGVVLSDWISGGAQVNPMVTVVMYCLRKETFENVLIKITAQLSSGYFTFLLSAHTSDYFNLTRFGGPEIPEEKNPLGLNKERVYEDCFWDEFGSGMLLLFAIFILNWELKFAPPTYKIPHLPPFFTLANPNYFIKQTLTAVTIRVLIISFPSAGPSINPMLGTTYYLFKNGGSQNVTLSGTHLLVYWVAPILGGCVAAVLYVMYKNGGGYDERFLGWRVGDGMPRRKKGLFEKKGQKTYPSGEGPGVKRVQHEEKKITAEEPPNTPASPVSTSSDDATKGSGKVSVKKSEGKPGLGLGWMKFNKKGEKEE